MPIRRLDRHRRVTVMGLGLFGGGVGAAKFWAGLGAEVTVTDLHTAEELAPSVEALRGANCRLVLGEHREEDFRNCDLLVVSPAVRPDDRFLRLARQTGARIDTEIGLALRIATGPVLAVTGSNGKSTTAALLAAMLSAHDPRTRFGGNIGGSLLLEMKDHPPSAPLVVELSSFQLHYLKPKKFAPAVAVVTNLAPNHLDWHKTPLRYYEDKRILLKHQPPDAAAILNAEDPTLRAWAEAATTRVILTARNDPETENACFLRGDPAEIVIRWSGRETALAPLAALKLPGAHNSLNALQAAAAAYAFTRDEKPVRAGLDSFGGLPHRLECVGEADGVRFVNDSKATTPDAAILALRSFEGTPVVLLAGGYDKKTPFDDFGREILKRARAVVLMGDTAGAIRTAVEAAARETGAAAPTLRDAGNDFDAAVTLARELCPQGGVTLLSPACASYGMFVNFERRGDRFRELVRAWIDQA